MASFLHLPMKLISSTWNFITETPLPTLILLLTLLCLTGLAFIYTSLFFLAPTPRPTHPSERTYITSTPSGQPTEPQPLPCWHDAWLKHRDQNESSTTTTSKSTGHIEPPEVAMSVVIPAYNEEDRLEIMLEEAVAYLDAQYGRPNTNPSSPSPPITKQNGHTSTSSTLQNRQPPPQSSSPPQPTGYEILLINDGSTDRTVPVALNFAHTHSLHNILRVCTLTQNRGKGGAVTHGLRHVRGQYAIFADADGASRFSDLSKLVSSSNTIDSSSRAVAVGSRAHLVGSDAVVKRSFLRNALMHTFHVLLRLMTPRQTSQIKDTQCGFKLFTRGALPHIVPYMHAEGWIFDVEMLMLAESAPGGGIRVAEVPVGWREVGGSKLNVLRDSVGMAWGLAVLRGAWGVGVYRRR